jgi:hypothetical protein
VIAFASSHLCQHGERAQLRSTGLADQEDLLWVAAMLLHVAEDPPDARIGIPQHVHHGALRAQKNSEIAGFRVYLQSGFRVWNLCTACAQQKGYPRNSPLQYILGLCLLLLLLIMAAMKLHREVLPMVGSHHPLTGHEIIDESLAQ